MSSLTFHLSLALWHFRLFNGFTTQRYHPCCIYGFSRWAGSTSTNLLHFDDVFRKSLTANDMNDHSSQTNMNNAKNFESKSVAETIEVARFSRTNRIDGRRKWAEKLSILKEHMVGNNLNTSTELIGINEVVEMSKELLYSGIPEQVLDLYSSYYNLISMDQKFNENKSKLQTSTSSEMSVIPDTRLILTTIRSFIALSDVDGAAKLFLAVCRSGIQFDATSKSLLITDFAESSAEGLKIALEIRSLMGKLNQKLSINAYASLLKGILDHSMQPLPYQPKLLVDSSTRKEDEDNNSAGELSSSLFRLEPDEARTLALEIWDDYAFGTNQSKDSETAKANMKKNYKVISELLRIVFRIATLDSKSFEDRNFEKDKVRTQHEQAQNGIGSALELMKKYDITWDIRIADVFMDECLRVGDLTGVHFVTETMQNNRLFARTNTFNALLRRYADDGDGESAHRIVTEVMTKSEETKPNSETWSLLLKACAKTSRGRFYSAQVIAALRETGQMNKDTWDRFLELCILSRKPYEGVLVEMIEAGSQPDQTTVLMMCAAFRSIGDMEGALGVYRLQRLAILGHESFFKQSEGKEGIWRDITWGNVVRGGNLKYLGLLLPPPTRKTVTNLLEALRDAGRCKDAVMVLNDLVSRARASSLSGRTAEQMATIDDHREQFPSPVSLISHMNSGMTVSDMMGSLVAPDLTTFAVVIESCVESRDTAAALATFVTMEQFGFQPDRRIYSALIQVFGLRNDVPRALGVFQEMRRNGISPDVMVLQNVLDVCVKNHNPDEFAQACGMLESLVNEGADLHVYSQDLLMQGFSDARSLGEALIDMESQIPVTMTTLGPLDGPTGNLCTVGLDVLSVLAQACRTEEGVDALKRALIYLGKMGIRADKETMDYFRFPSEPKLNSPNSRHYNRQLLPHKDRVRSLLDMEFPSGLGEYSGLPDRGFHKYESAPGGRKDLEPYFEPGEDHWTAHTAALMAIMQDENDTSLEDGEGGGIEKREVDAGVSSKASEDPEPWTEISGVDRKVHLETPYLEVSESLLEATPTRARHEIFSRTPRTRRSATASDPDVIILSGVNQLSARNDEYGRAKRRKVEKIKAIARTKAVVKSVGNKSGRT